MNYKTHSISGLGTGLIASKYLIQPNTINASELILLSSIVIASSILGSLFPDIDKNNSFAGNRAKIISSPIQFIFSHRGLFH
ncbi:MAG: hypothetical protein GX273_08135 [Bacteroidales bacterium]|nr:hypothetical protein [Bacteroidales bacterium]